MPAAHKPRRLDQRGVMVTATYGPLALSINPPEVSQIRHSEYGLVTAP